MSKLVTKIDCIRIETFDLSQEQHDLVSEMIYHNISEYFNYYIKEVDADILDIFIDYAKEEKNEERRKNGLKQSFSYFISAGL